MASIQHKIIVASLAIFALAGGSTVVGIWSAATLTDETTAVTRSAEVLRNHMQADMMHDALRSDVLAALLTSNPVADIKLESVKTDLAQHVAVFREMITANKALAKDGETQQVLTGVEPPLLAYIDSAARIVDQAGSDPAAAMKALPDFMTQFSALETAMEQAGDQIQSMAVSAADSSAGESRSIALLLKVMFGLTLVFSIALYVVGRRSITRPLVNLCDNMQRLASGDTDIDSGNKGRKDEIGSMASAVDVFRQSAIDNKRLENDAVTAREQSERNRLADQQRAEADAAERLRIATSGLGAGLKRLADGDLAFQIEEAFAPDFEALRHDLYAFFFFIV